MGLVCNRFTSLSDNYHDLGEAVAVTDHPEDWIPHKIRPHTPNPNLVEYWPETYHAYQDARKKVRERERDRDFSRMVWRVVVTVAFTLCALLVLAYWWLLP